MKSYPDDAFAGAEGRRLSSRDATKENLQAVLDQENIGLGQFRFSITHVVRCMIADFTSKPEISLHGSLSMSSWFNDADGFIERAEAAIKEKFAIDSVYFCFIIEGNYCNREGNFIFIKLYDEFGLFYDEEGLDIELWKKWCYANLDYLPVFEKDVYGYGCLEFGNEIDAILFLSRFSA